MERKFLISIVAVLFTNARLFSVEVSSQTQEYIALARKEYSRQITPPDNLNYDIIKVAGLGNFYIEKLIFKGLKSNLKEGQIWEPHIIPLFEQFVVPGSIAIDLGACFGVHTVRLAKLVGKNGLVFAFEPQKKLVREMLWNLKINKITNYQLFPFAVGNECKITSLGKIQIQFEGDARIGEGGQKCRLVTLDSFNISNLSFMKIDIENYEFEALKGAEKTIQNNRPVIVIELLAFDNPEKPDYSESKKAFDWLKNHNYKLYRLPPPHYQSKSYDFVCIPAERNVQITN